jgi:hypothetical protein
MDRESACRKQAEKHEQDAFGDDPAGARQVSVEHDVDPWH